MGRCLAMLALLAVGGCIGPEETRFLSLYQRDPDVESRAYDYHDPFPDESAGPETFTRPRTFSDPRTDTRKNIDLRFLQAMHPTAGQPQLAGVPVVRGPARMGPGGVPIPTGSPVANYPYPPGVVPATAVNVTPWSGVQVLPAY